MFTLDPLPFDAPALKPYMSEATLALHHGKHHQGYIDAVNRLYTGPHTTSLKEVIIHAHSSGQPALFAAAAQAWNHTFFWKSLKPQGGSQPTQGSFSEAFLKAFGTYEDFCQHFQTKATNLVGSGWVWLVLHRGALEIMATSNAELPWLYHITPLVVCDIWEHAYYLDYQNRRVDFVKAFTQHLVNWSFAEANFKKALS